MNKDEITEVMKLICEARDSARAALKPLRIFSDGGNWNEKYNDPERGRINRFSFLHFDPRGIAGFGVRELDTAIDALDRAWYEYRERLSKAEAEEKASQSSPESGAKNG